MYAVRQAISLNVQFTWICTTYRLDTATPARIIIIISLNEESKNENEKPLNGRSRLSIRKVVRLL